MSKTAAASRFRLRLRELREKCGLTQEELARAIGTDRSTVTQWETGYTVPRLQRLDAIADVLCCDVADFFDSVAKPAESRPSGGGARGPVRDIDSVEVAVGALEYLRNLAERASEHIDRADDILTDTPEDHVGARVHILYTGTIVDDIRQALDRFLELAES